MITRQQGFTLMETVLFIVVMGIALGAISQLFIESATSSHFPYQQQKAVAIANAYMDEIIHKSWDENSPLGGGCVETGTNYCTNYCLAQSYPTCDQCTAGLLTCVPVGGAVANCATGVNCGPDVGETRSTFNDIDDYDGLNLTPPQDAAGNNIAGYAGYNVQVSVSTPNVAWNSINGADVKQIDVTVTTIAPGFDSYTLTAIKVND